MMRAEMCPEDGPAMGSSAFRWPSDDLAAIGVNHPPNFVAAHRNGTENLPSRTAIRRMST